MKKILIFIANTLVCIGFADAAVRDGTSISRTKSDKNTQSRISTTPVRHTSARTTAIVPRTVASTASVTSRTKNTRSAQNTSSSRTAANTVNAHNTTMLQTRASNRTTYQNSPRAAITAAAPNVLTNTRTGAEYEQCKNTYFSCMDQFCSLKNDDYRRCSCNDRVFELAKKRETLQNAGEQLTVFTENLDVVGMTAAQATAMRTESEGEAALKSDKSASKALLQAIMNSIRGEDSTVGGKYSDLNSINISFDTVNAFGMTDVGQAIATYNGVALYNAVYPQCREAVRADCNDASLQRAINAYLMAIEQDCNTVQTALGNTQQEMKAAIREGSAMLDLARIENRQKHNSSDITTCINLVENAIQSEEVCGANYHKCLDNGEFIDISTGQPIAGVENFYQLEKLLTFNTNVEAAAQKLSKNNSNRKFVTNFESRVKKFAKPALDTCIENADVVWSEYLDIAMLDIYYAQRNKVDEIKQNCFDYISACYMNTNNAITGATSNLTSDSNIVIQPDAIALNSQMCTEYVTSCDNMFDGNIIAQYIENRTQTDTLTACRAVAKQCFDKYGGNNYENFYYPYSGLFNVGRAIDWFTLYEYDESGTLKTGYKSECAKQLANIDACKDTEMIEMAFGGLDYFDEVKLYGLSGTDGNNNPVIKQRHLRPSGVATETYNNVLSVLSTMCNNVNGRFVEVQQLTPGALQTTNNLCQINHEKNTINIYKAEPFTYYGLLNNEDMCPRDYRLGVDIQSWGICSCWENGGRRSKNGKSAKCMAVFPTLGTQPTSNNITQISSETPADIEAGVANDEKCLKTSITDGTISAQWVIATASNTDEITEYNWCTHDMLSDKNQVCPLETRSSDDCNDTLSKTIFPRGID